MIDAEAVGDLVAELCDRARGLPIVVVSDLHGESFVDAGALARSLQVRRTFDGFRAGRRHGSCQRESVITGRRTAGQCASTGLVSTSSAPSTSTGTSPERAPLCFGQDRGGTSRGTDIDGRGAAPEPRPG